jgi:crossover junction endodeoxyribonuclease RusA
MAVGSMTSPDTGRAGEVRVTLSWPEKVLSPNARVHWRVRARAVKVCRSMALWLTREAVGWPRGPHWASAAVNYTFCPPDKRARDRDNIIASLKSAQDGIADALGIDDSKFQTTYSMGSPVKGGAVIVTIRGIE